MDGRVKAVGPWSIQASDAGRFTGGSPLADECLFADSWASIDIISDRVLLFDLV